MIRLEQHSRRLALSAAILILFGLLTGGYISLAMSGSISANPSMTVASHLNALLGGFWLLGVGWSLQWCSLSETKAWIMVYLLVVANVANWLLTAIKAYCNVHALEFTGQGANDFLFIALSLFVVVPALAGCALWVWGLLRYKET